MDKIASSQELQQELRNLLAQASAPNPSRARLAAQLNQLAERVTTASAATIPAMFEQWCDLVTDAVEKKSKLGFTPRLVTHVESEMDDSADLGYQITLSYDEGHPSEYSLLFITLKQDGLHLMAIMNTDEGTRNKVSPLRVPLDTPANVVANRLMEMLADLFQKAGY